LCLIEQPGHAQDLAIVKTCGNHNRQGRMQPKLSVLGLCMAINKPEGWKG